MPDANRHSELIRTSVHHNFTGGMKTYEHARQLRKFLDTGSSTTVLACFSNAAAQTTYTVQDLGVQRPQQPGHGHRPQQFTAWTLIMDQLLDPFTISTAFPPSLVARTVRIKVTLRSQPSNSARWEERTVRSTGTESTTAGRTRRYVRNWHRSRSELAKIFAASARTLRCRPFLWQSGVMKALPTVGGNNGQASAINNKGQAAGYAENGVVDSTRPPGITNNRVDLPVMWDKGIA